MRYIRRKNDPANNGMDTFGIGSGIHVLQNVAKEQNVHRTNDFGRQQKNILKYCITFYVYSY